MAGGANSLGHVKIFERDREAVKRAAIGSRTQFLLCVLRLFAREIRRQRNEAMEFVVDSIDTLEQSIDEIDR